MPRKTYTGVNNVARQCKKLYVGQSSIAKKVKKGYVGVNGVAQLFYQSGYTGISSFDTIPGDGTLDIRAQFAKTNNYAIIRGKYDIYAIDKSNTLTIKSHGYNYEGYSVPANMNDSAYFIGNDTPGSSWPSPSFPSNSIMKIDSALTQSILPAKLHITPSSYSTYNGHQLNDTCAIYADRADASSGLNYGKFTNAETIISAPTFTGSYTIIDKSLGASGAIGNYIIIGGNSNYGQSTNVLAINESLTVFPSSASFSQIRRSLSAASNGKQLIFALGAWYNYGESSFDIVINFIDVFDASLTRSTVSEPNRWGSTESNSVSTDSIALFIGGLGNYDPEKDYYIYDQSLTYNLSDNTLPLGVYHNASGVFNDKVIIAGGYSGRNNKFDDVLVCNLV